MRARAETGGPGAGLRRQAGWAMAAIGGDRFRPLLAMLRCLPRRPRKSSAPEVGGPSGEIPVQWRLAMPVTEKYKTERIVRDLGPDWGRSIQDRITEEAAAYAQAELARMKDAATRDSISVRLPMWVTMRFPVRD